MRPGVCKSYESSAESDFQIDPRFGLIDFGGCVNILTPDRPQTRNSDGMGSNSCLVEFEPWTAARPGAGAGLRENDMTQWNMIVDVALCENCNNCILATKDEYVGNDFPGYSAPHALHGASVIDIARHVRGSGHMVDVTYVPTLCNHCDNAPCVKAATGRDQEASRWHRHHRSEGREGPQGHRQACPYGAIVWNEEAQLPQNWTFDAHLIDQGWKEPRCSHSCPTGVFKPVKVEVAEMERIAAEQKLETLKPQLETRPRVYYKNLSGVSGHFVGGSVVAKVNGVLDCIEGAEVTLSLDAKVLAATRTDAFGDFKFDGLTTASGQYRCRFRTPVSRRSLRSPRRETRHIWENCNSRVDEFQNQMKLRRKTCVEQKSESGPLALEVAGARCNWPAPPRSLPSAPFRAASAAPRAIKIGLVTPTTGPLAPMGKSDDYVLKVVREALKGGIANPAGNFPIEIIVKDSQSNPNRAAEVAGELILQDNIDLMVVGATPENSNPVCDQCELNGVPCISTTTPWQPWFFGRGAAIPPRASSGPIHYFWGIEDILEAFTSVWNGVDTNKKVGLFLANDGDGNAWGDPKMGLPPALTKMGFTVFDPGRFQPLPTGFQRRRSPPTRRKASKSSCGVPIPPDFINFWKQARQQGFHPKVGDHGQGLFVPVRRWIRWATSATACRRNCGGRPPIPYKSSLTGVTFRRSRRGLRSGDGASMERRGRLRALDVRSGRRCRSSAPRIRPTRPRCGTRSSPPISTRSSVTSTGAKGPMKNVCKTPLVAGQWVKGEKHKYDLVVVANTEARRYPGRAQADRNSLLNRERGRLAMAVVLSFENVSKNFGALKVTDDLAFEVTPGRGAGHSRPQRRGQDDGVQSDHRRAQRRTRATSVQGPGHRADSRRTDGVARASAAPIRSPCPSRA